MEYVRTSLRVHAASSGQPCDSVPRTSANMSSGAYLPKTRNIPGAKLTRNSQHHMRRCPKYLEILAVACAVLALAGCPHANQEYSEGKKAEVEKKKKKIEEGIVD